LNQFFIIQGFPATPKFLSRRRKEIDRIEIHLSSTHPEPSAALATRKKEEKNRSAIINEI
jgi:hypothetical protein